MPATATTGTGRRQARETVYAKGTRKDTGQRTKRYARGSENQEVRKRVRAERHSVGEGNLVEILQVKLTGRRGAKNAKWTRRRGAKNMKWTE